MARYQRWLRLRPQSSEDVEREIDDEIEAHLEMRTRELIAQGEPEARARAEAVRRFGDYREARRQLIRTHRAQHVRVRRGEWWDGLRRDFQYAWRRALRAPGFAIFAVLTFALSIGLTTATYTIVDDVLIRALPFAEPEGLVALQSMGKEREAFSQVSGANWRDWREQNRTLESTAILQTQRTSVQAGSEALRVPVTGVNGDFFRVLRTRLLAGRVFSEEELQKGANVVLVSESFWRRWLGADRSLREPVKLNGYAFPVIGVVRQFDVYPVGTDVWAPARYPYGTGATRNWINFEAIARLRPGVTLEAARSDLNAIAARIRAADPVALYSYGVGVIPLKDDLTSGAAGYLTLLLGAVGFVLLIACANLAGINIARGVARKHEMAVRLSLGAGRGALLRQVLLEHVLLALLGGLLGIAFAQWAIKAVVRAAAADLPRAHEIALDWRVVAVAAAITMCAGLLTGLIPALRLSGTALREDVSGARGRVQGGRRTPGAVLVAVEVALALVLLTGGGLLLRSYRTLLERPMGFQIRNVITAQADLPYAQYNEPARAVGYWQNLEERLRNLPGVTAAGAANWVPLGNGGITFIEIEGRTEENNGAGYAAVTDGYLPALGVRLLAGRLFNASDQAGSQRVTVINQHMAEEFWPGQNPIGRRLRAPGMESLPNAPPPAWLTVIGVVGSVRHNGPDSEMRPEIFTSVRQVPFYAASMTAIVQTSRDAESLIPAVRAQLRELDPTIAADLATQEQRLSDSLRWRRLLLAVLSGFAAVALLLAALGVYSMLSFSVAQRTREIAVRAALGARRANLLQLVFGQAMIVVLLGSAAGLAAALALTRLLRALLVDVSPFDPFTLAGVTTFLLLVAALAAALPALRAARLDPLVALQSD